MQKIAGIRHLEKLLLLGVLGACFCKSALGEFNGGPLNLQNNAWQSPLPVAAFRNINIADFKNLVIAAFRESNFTLLKVAENSNGVVQYQFSYPVDTGNKAEHLTLLVKTDGTTNGKGQCANCFLRLPTLLDDAVTEKLQWMAQYELSSRVFPDVDKAYAKIAASGQKFMDPSFKFDYKARWRGERNLYGNSVVAIQPKDLKALVVKSYVNAGFVFIGDRDPDSTKGPSELAFSFPIASNQSTGVVYKMGLSSQWDGDGRCYPCELIEFYDPYQQLPAAGLSGMSSRLMLESRFKAARVQAFEQLKKEIRPYLRPRSVFSDPPDVAPLGSPRVFTPAPVT